MKKIHPRKKQAFPSGRRWRPPSDYDRVTAMAQRGCTEEIIARVLFGVSDHKFLEMLRDDPLLRSAYKQGAAKVGRQLMETAYNLAPKLAKRGQVALLIFLLKTKYGFREVARIEGEITVKPGEAFAAAVARAPQEVQRMVTNLTAAEKQRLVKQFSADTLPPDGRSH